MKNKENTNSALTILGILSSIVALLLTLLLCVNFNVIGGNLGIKTYLYKLADDEREVGNYSDSKQWYLKIIKKKEPISASYACLAIGEMLSSEIPEPSYNNALKFYKSANKYNQDSVVLKSTLSFILQQEEIKRNNTKNNSIDFLDADNIGFFVEIVNKLNEIEPNIFKDLDITFPISEEELQILFKEDTSIKVEQRHWEYVSTLTTDKSSLAFGNGEEKLILVDSWNELVSDVSFETKSFYKYYRYKNVLLGELEYEPVEAFEKMLGNVEKTYVCKLLKNS